MGSYSTNVAASGHVHKQRVVPRESGGFVSWTKLPKVSPMLSQGFFSERLNKIMNVNF